MTDGFDVIVVGDSTIDTFVKIHEATIECDLNRQDCKICLNYGGKIPVDRISHGVGGGGANCAAGFSTLGLKCAVYTNLGNDWQGELIKEELYKKGVSGNYITFSEEKSSNLSVMIAYRGERTILVYHQNWYYKLPKLAQSKWLYFGSLSASFEESDIVDEILRFANKAGCKLAFAPGTYQLKAQIKKFPRLLEKCDFLAMNLEEAKQTLGCEQTEVVNVRDVLSKLLFLGPKTVLVTDGDRGSYFSDGQKYLKAPIFPVKLVEKTGAGDAFASTYVGALILGKTVEEALIWGTINSSHVIGQMGAQNGLMGRDEIERHRKVVPELVAIKL